MHVIHTGIHQHNTFRIFSCFTLVQDIELCFKIVYNCASIQNLLMNFAATGGEFVVGLLQSKNVFTGQTELGETLQVYAGQAAP